MEERLPDLRDTTRAFWQRRGLIAFATLVTAALAVLISGTRPDRYTSSSRVVLHPIVSSAGFTSLGSSAKGGPLGIDVGPETLVEIAVSRAVAERVAQRPEYVGGRVPYYSVSAELVTDDLLQISGTAGSPRDAAGITDAFAEEFLAYRKSVAQDVIRSLAQELKGRIDATQGQVNSLNSQIVTLTAQAASIAPSQNAVSPAQASAKAQRLAAVAQLTTQRDALVTQLASLRARYEDVSSAQSAVPGGEILNVAAVPSGPSSPKPVRDGLIGLFLGLMIGAGLALILHHFDDRVRTAGDVLRAGGISVVAGVPRARRWRRRKEPYLVSVAEPQSAPAEAHRALREVLTGLGVGERTRSVLVTSSEAGSGKTAIVANLAVACGQAGIRVAIVSADLRSSRVHEFFGLPNDRGLIEVLQEGRPVRTHLQATSIPNVYVLPSGAAARNATELLDRKHLDAVMRELLSVCDVVLVDAPSLSAGADALVLSRSCDMVLVTMRHRVATTSSVASAVSALRQAGARDIFAVLNMIEDRTAMPALVDGAFDLPAAANGNGGAHPVEDLRTRPLVASTVGVAESKPRRPRRATAVTPPADPE